MSPAGQSFYVQTALPLIEDGLVPKTMPQKSPKSRVFIFLDVIGQLSRLHPHGLAPYGFGRVDRLEETFDNET